MNTDARATARAFVYLAIDAPDVVPPSRPGRCTLPGMAGPSFAIVTDPLPTAEKPKHKGAPPKKTTVGTDAVTLANRRARATARALNAGKELVVPKPSEAPDSIPEDAEADLDDLAAVVVKKTQRLLAAGKVSPTLRDGLQAQQLLDRRAEKAADRRFMLNLAVAMAGGAISAPQKYLPEPVEDAIEGEFTDLDLAPAHLRRE